MKQHAPTSACVAAKHVTLIGAHGPLFEPVSFHLDRGESLCLMGPNGVGKSLFLKTIAMGSAPRPFGLRGLLSNSHKGLRRTFYLPQLQAPEIHLPYRLGEIAHREARTRGSLPWFDERIAQRAWNLASGGERMRALLARALASEASLLLLDEPFNHLDVETAEAVRATFRAESKGPKQRAFLLVSHAEERSGSATGEDIGFPVLRLSRPS